MTEHGLYNCCPLIRTPRLPAVDWTDTPADLNGLVRFAERPNLVSARVPSRFEHTVPLYSYVMCLAGRGNSFNTGTASTRTSVNWNAHIDRDAIRSGNVEFVEQVEAICLVVGWSSPSFGYKKHLCCDVWRQHWPVLPSHLRYPTHTFRNRHFSL